MRRFINLLSLATLAVLIISSCQNNKVTNVLVVAGGHNYDTAEFVDLFASIEGITFDTVMQPHANQLIEQGKVKSYDVIVFYDMWRSITEAQKQAYIDLAESGKGMIFMHHSIGGYQDWDEFQNILGGKYYTKAAPGEESKLSTYQHDIDIPVSIIVKTHPVTKDMDDFIIHDEGYGNILVKDDVTPLLKADHPDCDEIVGWTHEYKNSKIVYLMQGHDNQAYQNESLKAIVRNAIAYVK